MNIVAVKDNADFSVCGSIVYWSISGSTSYDSLCQNLKALGYADGELPPRMSPGKAVQMALENSHVTAGGKTKVLPVKDKPSGTVGLYQHQGGASSSNYRCLWSVRANDLGSVVFEGMAEMPDEFDKSMFMEEFKSIWGSLTGGDIGNWLAKIIRTPRFHGLGLRQHGGIYFIPPSSIKGWQELRALLTTVNMHSIPAMNGPDAINALVASLAEEATKLQEDILEVKRKAYEASKDGGGYGPRKATLERIEEQANLGLQKLKAYEQLLGQNLSNLSSKITSAVSEKETAEVLDL